MQATWYFWHRIDPKLDPDMVDEIMGEYDGWENCFLPHPAVMDLRRAVLSRWPDLVDDVYPVDPADFPVGFEPDPDAPPDLLDRVLYVLLNANRVQREGDLVQMAKARGLSCQEESTGRTAVQ
jgi:hypothetical protein